MSIQYAGGTIVNTTFVSDGTRAQLITQLRDALITAGWSVISGGGTTDVILKTAVTPQGCSVRFRLYDPGANNCAQITMKNSGALTSNISYILPTNGKTFRIIANQYQFFFFSTGAATYTTAREIAMGGTIYVSSGVLTNMGGDLEIGWFQYTGITDAGTTAAWSFRHSGIGETGGAPNGSTLYTGWMLNFTTWSSARPPELMLLTSRANISTEHSWQDASAFLIEPFISWSSTNATSGANKVKGIIWDAFMVQAAIDGETSISHDGHNWLVISHQAANGPCTLVVAVD